VESTMAGVETVGMKGNVARRGPSGGYIGGSSIVSVPAAGTRASSA